MYSPWIQFNWDGHRRGLLFQIEHDANNNSTRVSYAQLSSWRQDEDDEPTFGPYTEVEHSDVPRTLYDTIVLILSTNPFVLETYETPENTQLHESEIFKRWIFQNITNNDLGYLHIINTMTFQEKLNYDAGNIVVRLDDGDEWRS